MGVVSVAERVLGANQAYSALAPASSLIFVPASDYAANATILRTSWSLSNFAIDIAEASITRRLIAICTVTLPLPRTRCSSSKR